MPKIPHGREGLILAPCKVSRQAHSLGLEMPVKRESTPTPTALSGTGAVGKREEL